MSKSTEFMILNLVCMTLSIFCCLSSIISKSLFYDTIFIGAQWAFIGIQWMCIYHQYRYIRQENKKPEKAAVLGIVLP
jgi:hypothetical protein